MAEDKVFLKRVKENDSILNVFEVYTPTENVYVLTEDGYEEQTAYIKQEIKEVVTYEFVLDEYNSLFENYSEAVNELQELNDKIDEVKEKVDILADKIEDSELFINAEDLKELTESEAEEDIEEE